MRKRQPSGRPKKTCSKCGCYLEENRIGKQRYCLACHAQYMRVTRPRYSDLSDERRMKMNARAYLRVYIKRGKVKKKPCIICGNEKSEGHHKDYTKPLEVIWLCRAHHMRMHRKDEEIALPGTWLYKMLHPNE